MSETLEAREALLEATLALRRAFETLGPFSTPKELAEDRQTIRRLVECAARLRSQIEGKE